jgi:hypothetical protein
LLGHRGAARTVLKAHVDKGMLAAYPSKSAARLTRALSTILPAWASHRWFWDRSHLAAAIEAALGRAANGAAVDPAISDAAGEVMYWRPFLEARCEAAAVVLPIIPLPGTEWLVFASFAESFPPDRFPSDPVSPAVLEAASRAIYDLVAHTERLDRSIWERFDSPLWVRRGPYIAYAEGVATGDYRDHFRDFLDHGIMMAPDSAWPSIVPGDFDEGEIRYIVRLSQGETPLGIP